MKKASSCCYPAGASFIKIHLLENFQYPIVNWHVKKLSPGEAHNQGICFSVDRILGRFSIPTDL